MGRHLLPVALVLFLGCNDAAPTAAPQMSPSPPVAQSPSPEEASPSPEVITVPNVEGRKVIASCSVLTRVGLQIDSTEKFSNETPGTVLNQRPKKGSRVEVGSHIEVVVAKTLPRVPDVISLRHKRATRILEELDFEVTIRRQSSSSPAGSVISQSPPAGTEARPGRNVTIVVAKPEPVEDCQGYSPCLPPGPDVDCAGGSGDGPRYVQGPVSVSGSDPYGLDSDGDGVGCES